MRQQQITNRVMKKLTTAIVAAILSINTFSAIADVKQEIIARCRSQMGEYGSAMVKGCVDMDIKALNALNKYPKKYEAIISRCAGMMEEYGYAMIKACADQDIKAEKELSEY